LRNNGKDVFRRPSDGSGSAELIYTDGLSNKSPTSWSPDGKYLLYGTGRDSETGADLWILPDPGTNQTARKPIPFMRTRFDERQGKFSPDGHWVSYVSNESGKLEVYAAPFPGPGGKQRISVAGGSLARWRPGGKEIFYVARDGRLMAAEINVSGNTLQVGSVNALFGPILQGGGFMYDVAADGRRILAVVQSPPHLQPLTLVENWTALLKK